MGHRQPKGPSQRVLQVCVLCGMSRPAEVFAAAVQCGGHALERRVCRFVGRGRGANGGAVIWFREPLTTEQAAQVVEVVGLLHAGLRARVEGMRRAEADARGAP